MILIAWVLETLESGNVSVGDFLDHLVDAINDYWIDSSEEDQPLEK